MASVPGNGVWRKTVCCFSVSLHVPSGSSLWGNNIHWEFSRAERMPEAQRWCLGQDREDAQRVEVYDIQRMNSRNSLERYSGVRMIVAQVQWLYPLGISPLP